MSNEALSADHMETCQSRVRLPFCSDPWRTCPAHRGCAALDGSSRLRGIEPTSPLWPRKESRPLSESGWLASRAAAGVFVAFPPLDACGGRRPRQGVDDRVGEPPALARGEERRRAAFARRGGDGGDVARRRFGRRPAAPQASWRRRRVSVSAYRVSPDCAACAKDRKTRPRRTNQRGRCAYSEVMIYAETVAS